MEIFIALTPLTKRVVVVKPPRRYTSWIFDATKPL